MLTGTASVGPDHPETELEARLHRLGDPGELFIVDQLQVGTRQRQERPVSMTQDERNGALYPFSLAEKLECITERHDWYTPDGADSSPWGRAVVPIEMISVLAHKGRPELPVRGPSLGLFLDLEVRLIEGPVFVDQEYVVEHEILGLGQSRRTESYWTRSTLTDTGRGAVAATVLLHSGVFKESYPGYPKERLSAAGR